VKSTLEDVGPWQKAIAITLDPEEVEREMDQVVSEYRSKVVIPGFRKGKVPNELIRANYRSSIESDLLNQILPDATARALQEHSLEPAAPPRIKDLSFRPGEPLTFTAVVDLWPKVEATGYRGIELDEVIQEVDEQVVEEFLQALRERNAEVHPVFRPSQPGDILEVSLQAVDIHGERLARAKRQELRMEAAGQRLLPEFRQASVGIEPGAVTIVHIRYPDDFGDQELAGQTRHYRMHVRQILEKNLPELDDAFAGKVDNLESLEGLKSKIRLRLEAEERLQARQRTEEALVDRLIAANPFELPESIIKRTLDRILEKAREETPNLDEEEFQRTYTPLVERTRRREIILESIARQESLEATEDELEAEIARSAPQGVDPQVVRRKLEKDGDLERIRNELQERKIFGFLMEASKINRVHQPRARKSNLILP
jgi:trigger factor